MEKSLDNIQYLFSPNTLNKLGTERTQLYITMSMDNKPMLILTGWRKAQHRFHIQRLSSQLYNELSEVSCFRAGFWESGQ